MESNILDFDFTPIGLAIKKAREAEGMTREQLSGIIGKSPRHIQAIENEYGSPSVLMSRWISTSSRNLTKVKVLHGGVWTPRSIS